MTHLLEEAIRAHSAGAIEVAADLYEQFLKSEPAHFPALNALGVLRGQLNQPALGLQSLEKALAIEPENGDANANMGMMLGKLEQYPQAIGFLTKAIEKHPDNPNYMLNLAFLLQDYEKPDDAITIADIVIALYPTLRRAYHAKGNALLLKSDGAGAVKHYHVALQDFPDDPGLWSNLGTANRWLHDPNEALRCHDIAVTLETSGADAQWERALTLLSFGQFEAGWRDYVASKKEQGLAGRPNLGRTWNGRADLRNKSIFIYREQGLGDSFQFCRFLKHLSQLGAKVFFAPHGSLKWLMASLEDSIEICDFADQTLRTDYHAPLLSLPAYFHTQAAHGDVPYLFPSEENTAKWRGRLGAKGFKIGICWQGSTGKADFGRSFPLLHFKGISELPGVRLISLHRGDGEEQLKELPGDMRVETLGSDFDSGPDSFFDSAAVMKSLDLVITSDTAVAHLAGALGAPVWVALKSAPDWRWMMEGYDSLWYPTMRLFRQQSAGDWAGVFAQMEAALRARL